MCINSRKAAEEIYNFINEMFDRAAIPVSVIGKIALTIEKHCEQSAPIPVKDVDDFSQYEDQLPKTMSQTDYDRWFAMSRVVDGVRMGPRYPK